MLRSICIFNGLQDAGIYVFCMVMLFFPFWAACKLYFIEDIYMPYFALHYLCVSFRRGNLCASRLEENCVSVLLWPICRLDLLHFMGHYRSGPRMQSPQHDNSWFPPLRPTWSSISMENTLRSRAPASRRLRHSGLEGVWDRCVRESKVLPPVAHQSDSEMINTLFFVKEMINTLCVCWMTYGMRS
jgi:hypothetical protein